MCETELKENDGVAVYKSLVILHHHQN